jgi:hypothetical protein
MQICVFPGLPLQLGRDLQGHPSNTTQSSTRPLPVPKRDKVEYRWLESLQPQPTELHHYKPDIFDSTLDAGLPRNLISTASVATPIDQSLRPFAVAVHSVGAFPHTAIKMGMWILEPKSMEHVPGMFSTFACLPAPRITSVGTTRYFDDPERPQAATSESVGLKCDTSGPIPIILVPQPSDDPNDPLVGTSGVEDCTSTNIGTELASVEARRYPRHPLRRFDLCDLSRTYTCSKHYNLIIILLSRIWPSCNSHRIFSAWCRSCRHISCSLGQNLGKETFVPFRNVAYHYLKCLGRSFEKLCEPAMG